MQQDIATTRSIEGKDGPAITVGLDVGDRYTHVHALGAGGEVIRERRVRTGGERDRRQRCLTAGPGQAAAPAHPAPADALEGHPPGTTAGALDARHRPRARHLPQHGPPLCARRRPTRTPGCGIIYRAATSARGHFR